MFHLQCPCHPDPALGGRRICFIAAVASPALLARLSFRAERGICFTARGPAATLRPTLALQSPWGVHPQSRSERDCGGRVGGRIAGWLPIGIAPRRAACLDGSYA